MEKKQNNWLDEMIKGNKTVSNLIRLKEEANRAFDEQIERLMVRKGIIRRIKVPKIRVNFRYIFSVPFIYGMLVPSVFFHVCIEIYHQLCFRFYGIPRVDFREYFIYDRQLLSMLNAWEKVNCLYCSYVNNLIRYSCEIGGRTERYWCPIKYYRRVGKPHSQYKKFVDVEDSEKFREKWEELRDFSDLEKK